MSTRPGTATIADARAQLQQAAASVEAAVPARDPDVIAAHAISAALSAADAICCVALRERPADGSRQAAVDLLGRIDKKLSSALQRALDRQIQATGESRDISLADARMCLRQAEFLLDAARDRVLSI
ncbi:MAG TPA: hypothetical protein VGI58_14650 [Streptosporangiaceae bacterium]|jgi:hypothetical protein